MNVNSQLSYLVAAKGLSGGCETELGIRGRSLCTIGVLAPTVRGEQRGERSAACEEAEGSLDTLCG